MNFFRKGGKFQKFNEFAVHCEVHISSNYSLILKDFMRLEIQKEFFLIRNLIKQQKISR